MSIQKPTMEEAKRRWAEHTRHVLTQEQRRDFRDKYWAFDGDYPAVFGDTLVIHFYKNECGYVYASFLSPLQESNDK